MICKYYSICSVYDNNSPVCISETLPCFLRDDPEIREEILEKLVLEKSSSLQIPLDSDSNN
jgi:hypothetical protein